MVRVRGGHNGSGHGGGHADLAGGHEGGWMGGRKYIS